jgi:hypothetical protein
VVRKAGKKRSLRKPKRRWEDSIEMDRNESGGGGNAFVESSSGFL